jgi:hypothetical protein
MACFKLQQQLTTPHVIMIDKFFTMPAGPNALNTRAGLAEVEASLTGQFTTQQGMPSEIAASIHACS